MLCPAKTGMINGPVASVATAAGIVASEAALDDDETLLGGRIYEHLGFLIVEGRSTTGAAAATAKGRRDGSALSHCCPQLGVAPALPSAAMAGSCGCCCGTATKSARQPCKDVGEEGSRVQAHRKEMATMWCNGIPLCVEMLLCINCELDDGASVRSEAVGAHLLPQQQQPQHDATDPRPLADVATVGQPALSAAAACPTYGGGHHNHHRHRGGADSSVDEGGVRAGAYVLLEQWVISVQPERRVGHVTCSSSTSLGHHSSSAAAVAATSAGALSGSSTSYSGVSSGSTSGAANGSAGAGQATSAHACSLADLVQAIKSHLYFSQLSAWLQMSHGQRPRHVVYRLTTPGEWFRHSFMSEPVNHAFPAAVVGARRHIVKVSLASLPRTEQTASELCAEARRRHLLQQQQQQQQQQLHLADHHQSPLYSGLRSPPIPIRRQHKSLGCWLDKMGDGALLYDGSTTMPVADSLAVDGLANTSISSAASLQSPRVPHACLPSQLPSSHVSGRASPLQPEALSSRDSVPLLRQPQQRQPPLSSLLQTSGDASSITLDPMGAFGESGARSVSEVTLIGCRVGTGHSSTIGCGFVRLSSPQLPAAAAATTAASRSCRSLRTVAGAPCAALAADPNCWPRQPPSATAAAAAASLCGTRAHAPQPAHGSGDGSVRMPPKSPKVLFSAWVNDGGAGDRKPAPQQLGDGSAPSRQAANPSVSSCRMRLSFDDDDPGDSDCSSFNDAPKRDGDSCVAVRTTERCEAAVERGVDRTCVGDAALATAEACPSPSLRSTDSTSSATCWNGHSRSVDGATAVRPQTLWSATDSARTARHQSACYSDEEHGKKVKHQPVFALGDDAPGGSDFDDGVILAGCESRRRDSNGIEKSASNAPAAVANAATSSGGGRMKRSGESFPRFSKLRLNERPASFSSQSSPAPVKRLGDRRGFHFDAELAAGGPKAIKSALSCGSLSSQHLASRAAAAQGRTESNRGCLSTSAPAAAVSLSSLPSAGLAACGAAGLATSPAACTPSSALLGNFEETLLNGRMEPAGVIDGFSVDLGASGSFCPQHVRLPVKAYFFGCLSDDNAPSPYLGYVDLQSLGKRGYQLPRKGTLQVTLFNPNLKVVKMFVVLYDLEDMPPRSQTFLRQRTVYAPTAAVRCASSSSTGGAAAETSVVGTTSLPTYLRYLIHMRFATSKTGKLYLHTDLRLIFARDKFEFDTRVAASYEMRSYTEAPSNPKFSPFS